MLKQVNPTSTAAWKALEAHYAKMKNVHMKDLFETDASRAEKFSLTFEDIFVDYSKNIIDDETMTLLLQLAKETGVAEGIQSMFNGEHIRIC